MNNNPIKSSKAVYFAGMTVSLVCAVCAAAIYAAAYHFSYDIEIQHYDSASKLILICSILLVFSVLSVLLTSFYVRCKVTFSREQSKSILVDVFLTQLLAFMFIGYFIAYLFEAHPTDAGIFDKICPVVGIASSIPYFCYMSEKTHGGVFQKTVSAIPVLWGMALLLKYYFNVEDIALNNPELILTNVVISSLIIFFLSESRSMIGINTPFIKIFACAAAAFIAGPISIVRIVLAFTDGIAFPTVMENILIVIVAMLALGRLCTLAGNFKLRQNKPKSNEA